MNAISRRHLLKLMGASTLLAASPGLLRAQTGTVARVVVVGGGFAGATVAKYLRLWSGGSVAVTLVDANLAHTSCILSNLVLNGSLDLRNITFDYAALGNRYGVDFVQGQVESIGSSNNPYVQLSSGQRLDCERLILAPGIDFDTIPGLDSTKVPHAWQAGPQTTLLKQQLAAMRAGGTFVMTVPPAPYRCPPGPYERACLVADYLKRTKPGSKVIVLDANPGIVAEVNTFTKAFTQTYAGIVTYVPNVTVLSVDSTNRSVETNQGRFGASVLNVIPPQKAGSFRLQDDAGLIPPGGRWASVNPLSYESTLDDVHVIGDAQGTSQPKSGHIANAEAKVCADALLRAFAGEQPDPAPMTNSACYSPITTNTASWLTAVFAYDPVSGTMKAVPASSGEAPAPTQDHFEKMFDWADNLFADTFA